MRIYIITFNINKDQVRIEIEAVIKFRIIRDVNRLVL